MQQVERGASIGVAHGSIPAMGVFAAWVPFKRMGWTGGVGQDLRSSFLLLRK